MWLARWVFLGLFPGVWLASLARQVLPGVWLARWVLLGVFLFARTARARGRPTRPTERLSSEEFRFKRVRFKRVRARTRLRAIAQMIL